MFYHAPNQNAMHHINRMNMCILLVFFFFFFFLDKMNKEETRRAILSEILFRISKSFYKDFCKVAIDQLD